jgi:alginate O-acetyltransferase complex protein AlgI
VVEANADGRHARAGTELAPSPARGIRRVTFTSFTFFVFFMAVMALHNMPFQWTTKKVNLLIASIVFYASWNPIYVGLLIVSSFGDYILSWKIFKADKQHMRTGLLIVSLMINLGVLGFFKYALFLLQNVITALAAVGVHYSPPAIDILLPIGISFYTFQTLSYTIDVYRRNLSPANSFLDYALYVGFFPQLVAGPIVRASKFLPQCVTPRRAEANRLGWGLSLMVLGLFEKKVLADTFLAPVVENVYDATSNPSVLSAWSATLAFSGEIFADFAGYSTIAIGVAMCLGFALPDNFRFPYAAIGFSDFWRRWHISLSTWLRDYLYISLGGNRRGPGCQLASKRDPGSACNRDPHRG